MATRCCWPPESWTECVNGALLRVVSVGVDQRQLDILYGGGSRQQVELLEDEADRAIADGR
jgi:hypothetical protein